jgi:PPM family protein phosphatase
MTAMLETPVAPLESKPATAQRTSISLISHGLTDQGRRRRTNEDQFLISTLTHALCVRKSSVEQQEVQCGEPRAHLFVVADGMGGHAGGDQASAMAVQSIEDCMVDSLNWCAQLRGDGSGLLEEFQKALKKADRDLAGAVRAHPELRGMGTTVTLAYVVGNELFIAHAGDSRCYLLRDRKLHLLTHDHTLVQAMVDRGIISQEEAATHHLRHVIANVVGGADAGVNVELHKLVLEPGDRLLLCSDGLSGMVENEEIATILDRSERPETACHRLVDRANEQGGKDNITAVVVYFRPAGNEAA